MESKQSSDVEELAPNSGPTEEMAGALQGGAALGEHGLSDQLEMEPEKSGQHAAGPEIVREITIRVLSERIALLGINKSGAYEHYNSMLARGFPIPPYEIAIVDFVRKRLPALVSYHEIGSGLATLPLMLAYEGFAAVGVERDERRNLTATKIFRTLSGEVPRIEANCRLIGANFPEAIADLDVSNSLAIVTDFVASQSVQGYKNICLGLTRYRYILLDLQRFCVKRESQQDQERLVEELAGYGLVAQEDIIDFETEGYYRLFFNPSPGSRYEAEKQTVGGSQPSGQRRLAVSAGDTLTASKELVPAAGQALAPVPAEGRELQARPQDASAVQLRTPAVDPAPVTQVLLPTGTGTKRGGGPAFYLR